MLGHVWESFINSNDLTPGEDTLLFSMKQCPARIYVATVPKAKSVEISSDDDSLEEEEEEDEEVEEAEESDDRTTVVGQRADLTDDEKDRLAQLLPVGPHVGVLFMTRLTTTNLR